MCLGGPLNGQEKLKIKITLSIAQLFKTIYSFILNKRIYCIANFIQPEKIWILSALPVINIRPDECCVS